MLYQSRSKGSMLLSDFRFVENFALLTCFNCREIKAKL